MPLSQSQSKFFELCGEPLLSAKVLMKLISGGQKASFTPAHTLLATVLLMHQCPVSCSHKLFSCKD